MANLENLKRWIDEYYNSVIAEIEQFRKNEISSTEKLRLLRLIRSLARCLKNEHLKVMIQTAEEELSNLIISQYPFRENDVIESQNDVSIFAFIYYHAPLTGGGNYTLPKNTKLRIKKVQMGTDGTIITHAVPLNYEQVERLLFPDLELKNGIKFFKGEDTIYLGYSLTLDSKIVGYNFIKV